MITQDMLIELYQLITKHSELGIYEHDVDQMSDEDKQGLLNRLRNLDQDV
ncbi:hypothetical protein [Solemya velum gill symbiont]|nr:hypothetical protein [Solemya velum gill symbiont]